MLYIFAICSVLASTNKKSCIDLDASIEALGAPSGVTLARQCVADAGAADPAVSHAFKKAMEYRHEDIALELLQLGAHLPERHEAILLASSMELPGVVEALLRNDPTLANVTDEWGYSPMRIAAIGGAYMATRALLANGGDPNLGLLPAIQENRLQIAYLLLENGASWRELPDEQAAELFGAAARNTDETFLQYLLAQADGYDLNQLDSRGQHVLLYAVNHRDEEIGDRNWFYLVNHGADPLLTVCGLSPSEVEGFRQYGPSWFVRKIDWYRPKCDQITQE